MEYYFDDLEEQKRLKIILDEWVGTPFRHHCGVKGMGCDCIHFVGRVLEETGVLIWKKGMVPDYPRDWHLHNTREALQVGILEYLNVEEVSAKKVMNGDIILSHYGMAASHSGIFYDKHVYQSLNGVGVVSLDFNDKKFRTKMKFFYRILGGTK